jgi:hypothetical protein
MMASACLSSLSARDAEPCPKTTTAHAKAVDSHLLGKAVVILKCAAHRWSLRRERAQLEDGVDRKLGCERRSTTVHPLQQLPKNAAH